MTLSCSERSDRTPTPGPVSDGGHELAELRDRLSAAEAALDHVRCAVLVLDAQARIRTANRAARRLLCEGDGLAQIGTVLIAQFSGDAAALRQSIARAAGADGAAPRSALLSLRRGPGRPPLAAVAIPSDRHVLLFVADPAARPTVAAELLRVAFGLTRREVAVALHATTLGGLPAAAAQMNITPTTARSHLQHVFDKTGTRSQLALAQLLSALGALPDPQALAGANLTRTNVNIRQGPSIAGGGFRGQPLVFAAGTGTSI
jgi:DNA-binding CsgD family transcriptional regulator